MKIIKKLLKIIAKARDKNKLKDDTTNKIKLNVLSGSLNQPEERKSELEKSIPFKITLGQDELVLSKSENESIDKKLNEISEELVSMFLESQWLEKQLKDSNSPYYILKKPDNGKSHWLLDIQGKLLREISYNVDVMPVSEIDEDTTACMIGTVLFSVPNDILVCIGYN